MKKKTCRSLAVLLIFSICIALLPVSAIAVTEEATEGSRTPTLVDFIAGTATAEDIYGTLDASTVPAIINYEEAVANNHIARLYEDEGTDLNKVIFLNIDGTKTMYTFDFPVKYVDDNGIIQDIRLDIVDSAVNSGSFETAANATTTTFSTNFADGIFLSGNDTDIQLIPILSSAQPGTSTMSTTNIAATATAQRIDTDTIAYRYDEKTIVEYSLTYTGFKEDIVINEYTGQTEYPFRLLTNGLALEEIEGSFFLVNDDGNIEASIGDIIIFTADERNNAFGDIEAMTIVENQEYLLNIVVDADYLADPATIYPIRIDPTVEINYNDNGAGAIEDITISTNTNFTGYHTSLYIGRRSTEGIARALMRFPGLDLSNLAGATITSATVRVRDLMCEDNYLDVSCHVFTGNVWNGNSATWANSNPNSYISTPLSTNTLSWYIGNEFSSKHWYSFDITSAVQGWIDGNYNPNKGIIFKVAASVENGSTVNNRTFGAYNRESNRPSLTINYAEPGYQYLENDIYYLNNRGTGKYLQLSTTGVANGVSGLLNSLGNRIQWQTQKVNGGYVIRSVNDPTKYLSEAATLTSSSVTITTVSDAAIPQNCIWSVSSARLGGCLIRNTVSGNYLYSSGIYLYTTANADSYSGTTYERFVWRMAPTSYYGTTSSYTIRELESGFSIDNLIVNIGQSKKPSVQEVPFDAAWANPSDFTFVLTSGTSACVSIAPPANEFTGLKIGIATYTATHKVTGRTTTFKVYVDRYTYELTNFFGFESDISLLIRNLYDKIDACYSSESERYKAWVASRVLSEFCYDDTTIYFGILPINTWDDVAGSVTSPNDRKSYFVDTLEYSEAAYNKLNSALNSQHLNTQTSDFAHMQYSLASRLAYTLHLDGILSNIYTTNNDEIVSYLAGWYGDATLKSNGTTVFGNDDYMSDLDAENLFRYIDGGANSITAINAYYQTLAGSSGNRATIFKSYLSYATVENTVLSELGMTLSQTKASYPDTYDFLMSLKDGRAEIAHY
ncbi:MAG: DNRLRE domain-containing protein [Ruminococcaceae bacterium]|nr:DNRLRE domain-containing protein [Oscillospiraceae bacterium]